MDAAPRGDISLSADDFIARAARGPWPAFRDGAHISAAADAFLRGLYEDASADELGDLAFDDLIALAHDFWKWRSERAPQEQAVRIRPGLGVGGRPLGRDILEIAGPDMPFLVDSVMGELADQSVAALAMFHPVAPAADGEGRDSLIHVHLPPLTRQRAMALHEGVRATLADVRIGVADHAPMRQRMLERADELRAARTNAPDEEVAEAVLLLQWLASGRFIFLGARDYRYGRDAAGEPQPEPVIEEESGLGILRDPTRYVLRVTAEPMVLAPELKRLFEEPNPLIVAKSTLRARVHRRTAADYVGVKRYDARGEVVGETRFIGLFTSEAFTEPTRDIPVLRRKLAWVMREAGFARSGHNANTLRHILETFPRDELWQTEQEDLLSTARGVVHLLDRPRPRVFFRRDRFNRFVSALAYLPKDRFNSDLRRAVGERLEQAFGGRVEAFYPELGEGPLARVHFVIGDTDRNLPDPDPAQLDADIAALTRKWEDAFAAELARSDLFEPPMREEAARRFEGAFTAAYKERFGIGEALIDAALILGARSDEAVRARVYRLPSDPPTQLRCKFYARDDVLALSTTVPILENMGLFVEAEQSFELQLAGEEGERRSVFVHDLEARAADGAEIDLDASGAHFEQAFAAIWTGRTENDGFNRLILKLGIAWREAALIRALARYRQQTGLDPTQAMQEQALAAYPEITASILALFRVRFDPSLPETLEARADWSEQIEARIEAALGAVPVLDEDRVLRRIAALVMAICRTNYYQTGADGAPKPAMSFKIESGALADLPAPKPYREIWVASPQVEGVHLRMGAIARGGLRWTDRRDDFRTEILDLVKAQQVKNAIIVPAGAKGGFFPKRLPPRTAPAFLETGKEAYRTFLRALLDLTDNLVGGAVVPPRDVVRWDGNDTYLVVAADKGTASFSDIANAISGEYGFWLGDAFASGGSAGYDHKEMGITARGAWEAVKRHFREIGKNIQEEPFTVIGIGDMSGDVFGNGMLLSKKTRLLAAFDHRHIFVDPAAADPDAAWSERKRLFEKPGSNWADYDPKLIGKGGGVFARSLKAIPVTPEIAALTGLTSPHVTPAELINALLAAPCDLLWLGGVGTFVKAKSESHADVGDKANDALRVDAESVQALVVGEGANLGVTQKGRIAFARKGGRINTDAVDNSAGVDTSDHEVNIKILLAEAARSGSFKASQRDTLLASMTQDVGALVLEDNYDQTLGLSVVQARAHEDIDSHERFVQRLESAGKLSRVVEGLPSAEEFAAMRAAREGLTRPELAKLLAYSKIDLKEKLLESDTPDDPALFAMLRLYFPPALHQHEAAMADHPLRRAIVATLLADEVVNVGGPSFVDRVCEVARVEPVAVARAFEAIRRIFALDGLRARIDALDNAAPASAQLAMHQEIAGALHRMCAYLARRPAAPLEELASRYRPAIEVLAPTLWDDLSAVERGQAQARRDTLTGLGAPDDLAGEVALLRPSSAGLDIVDLAQKCGWSAAPAGLLYRAIGAAFGMDVLRAAALSLRLEQHWDRLLARRTAATLFEDQRLLAEAAARAISKPPAAPDRDWAETAAAAWIDTLGAPAQAARRAFADLEAQGPWSFAKLMIGSAEITALANALR